MKLRWILLILSICLIFCLLLSSCRKSEPEDIGLDFEHNIPISDSSDDNREEEDETVDQSLGGGATDQNPVTPSPSDLPEETRVWNVLFRDMYGIQIELQKVKHGEAAVSPKVPRLEGYRFVGWDRSYENVTSNLVVTGQYEELAIDDIARLKYSTPAKDGTCSVLGLGTYQSDSLVIPTLSPDGATVTSIAERAFYRADLPNTLTLPASIQSIGAYAFAETEGLTKLRLEGIPEKASLTAFEGCTNLHWLIFGNEVTEIPTERMAWLEPIRKSIFSVTFGEKLNRIGNDVFLGCIYLVEVQSAPSSHTWKGFFDTSGIGLHLLESTDEMTDRISFENGFFFYRNQSTGCCCLFYAEPSVLQDGKLELPAGAGSDHASYEIGARAFSGWTGIQTLVVPAEVLRISSFAFENCSSIEHVRFNSQLPILENYAFANTTAFALTIENLPYHFSIFRKEGERYWHFRNCRIVLWANDENDEVGEDDYDRTFGELVPLN